jgi:hypothetical protein
MNTIKEALEGAKKYLWDGVGEEEDKSEYICHAAAFSVAASQGLSDLHEGLHLSLSRNVERHVEAKLEGNCTAVGLASDRGVNVADDEALQAFRLAFIDELIAGLE